MRAAVPHSLLMRGSCCSVAIRLRAGCPSHGARVARPRVLSSAPSPMICGYHTWSLLIVSTNKVFCEKSRNTGHRAEFSTRASKTTREGACAPLECFAAFKTVSTILDAREYRLQTPSSIHCVDHCVDDTILPKPWSADVRGFPPFASAGSFSWSISQPYPCNGLKTVARAARSQSGQV
jgi:hypothetical protein